MPGLGKPIMPEDSIIRGLVLDSRDLFAREKYEERLDYQLAVFTQQFQRNRTVDRQQVRSVVEEFIKDVELILRELEDAKRKAEQEEIKKIYSIKQLLEAGAKINSKKFKKELERFGELLKSNTIAGLKQYKRREGRLRRGKTPIGFFLKKVRKDKALDEDIARRTGKSVEEIRQEHQLSSEVDFLIKALGKIQDRRTYEQLEERLKLLVKTYEKDLEDFLNIEIDIEIEEARKLYRIDHYITFLKMVSGFDGLIKRLNELKAAAQYWVYQDSIDAKKLVNYAKALNYGLSILKASEAAKDENFPGIVVQNSPIEGIVSGLLIYNKDKPQPTRAVVLVHAVYKNKETLLTFGKKLAMLDFWVYSIDITSHGESREKLHLGRSCEYVQIATRWFRLNGIRNVAVIGHSLGAVITLFALCGYNKRVENWFYGIMTRLIQRLNYIIEKSEQAKPEERNKVVYEMINQSKEYEVLKEVVVNAMKRMYGGQSRIDAVVLLSAPLTTQFVFPTSVAKRLKRLPKNVHWLVGKGVTKFLNWKFRRQEGKGTPVFEQVAKKGEVQVLGAVYSDVYYTYNYAQTVKNPYDFIDLINSLCDKIQNPENPEQIEFFRYYRELIRDVPKLFIYGLADRWLKPLKGNNMPDLEKHYENMSKEKRREIVRYPDVVHALNKEGKDLQFESGKLPKLTYKVVTFLNRYLGSGRRLL